LAEAAAELVAFVDSFGALNIAEASGFELLTVMLIKSFNCIWGSGMGNLLAIISSLIVGK
jgi:hypothetical protein